MSGTIDDVLTATIIGDGFSPFWRAEQQRPARRDMSYRHFDSFDDTQNTKVIFIGFRQLSFDDGDGINQHYLYRIIGTTALQALPLSISFYLVFQVDDQAVRILKKLPQIQSIHNGALDGN